MNSFLPAVLAILLPLLTTSSFGASSADGLPTPFATSVSGDDLDPATFAEWVDGNEKLISDRGITSLPQSLLWLGPNAVPSGHDDSQWIPAQRIKQGKLSTDEAGPDEQVLWVLPAVTITRALRFTHVAQTVDHSYAGSLAGAAILPDRLVNLAPQAWATASATPQHAGRLIDEINNGGKAWDNIPLRDGNRPQTIAENPEWAMLIWSHPVSLQGLALLGNGFGAVEAQVYAGPPDQHPRTASDANWQTVENAPDLKNHSSSGLGLDWIDFGRPVTTRAVRLRFTSALDETGSLLPIGSTKGGKRGWLDEILALQSLNDADLETALPAAPAKENHAPIAIKFTLPENGLVTLVMEDSHGQRLRNLIAETPFPKGENTVYWDGTDDLGRDLDAVHHGIYDIPAQFVMPGTYSARGLWHRPIDLRYQMSVYSPGHPPWPTQDGTGGWMTNHTPASCAVFVPGNKAPGGQPTVFIGSFVSEGGSALSWLDLDGNKMGGRGWIGGNWTGAQFLAYDDGPDAVPGIYAYVGAAWRGLDKPQPGQKNYGVIRLTGLTSPTSSGDKPVLTPVYTFDLPPNPDDVPIYDQKNMGGLAVHNGLLVFSQPSLDQLVFVDAKAGKVVGVAPVSNPKGLAFDQKGRLLVLSEKALLRFTLDTSPLPLGKPEMIVANLEEPVGLTVDGQDNIYISDRGTSHQVKVFSAEGTPVKTYGRPGAPQAGPYDPDHMNNPKGLAVDSNGRLWVTEEDFQPKRISVWNSDGTLWKAFYGPQEYGGGGFVDSHDPTRFSYNGMEFHLDWDKGESSLTRVYYRLGHDMFQKIRWFMPPDWALYLQGKRYLSNAFSNSPTSGAGIAFLFLDQGNVAVPAAAMGRATDWDMLKGDAFKALWPQGTNVQSSPLMFVWNDLNGDGLVQPNEVKTWNVSSGGVTMTDDGSFVVNNVHSPGEPGHVMRFSPSRFTERGVPVYEKEGEILADAQGPASSGGDQALVGTDGWTVLTTAPPPYSNYGLGGVQNGVALWSYPSLWPGLHASHESPEPEEPGELIGTTRLLGDFVTPKNSDAGPLFFINGNQGDMYVFSQDGLFVTQLFKDIRQGIPWQMPVAQKGMLVNDLTVNDESFYPTVTQVPDGSIYMTTGKIPALVKVDGLESIHRIAAISVDVSADDLKLAQDFVTQRESARQAAEGSGVLKVTLRSQAPDLQDWADADWAPIDQRGVAAYFNSNSQPYDVQAAVTIADGKLFALWKTADPRLLRNSGEIDNAPFKTGGALDLMLGTDLNANPHRVQPVAGDLRLLVTQIKGKTKAMLYRAVVPGTPEIQKVQFSAPWHSTTLDSVTDVSDQVQLTPDNKGNYEIAVPLNLLGLHPRDGTRINGDIGILRGDGTQTIQRIYWNNKATAIVSDVPSEAMLTPGLWGVWEFHSK
jgi:hypothetical protein